MAADKVITPARARNCFLFNQFGAPGLGSLLAGRYISGGGQLLLSLVGFGLVVAWFICLIIQFVRAINEASQPKSVAWLGITGAVVFAIAWLWALSTSFQILRSAKDDRPPGPQGPPPVPK
jgi:hypothetical protein